VTKSLVIRPIITELNKNLTYSRHDVQALEEAVFLALAIDLDVEHAETVTLSKVKAATLLGSGTVERFSLFIKDHKIDLVILDCHLSPGQQRNLEKSWSTKVIDRTGLILEIFGARARTREGRLQVELAALSYQKSRLVRSWTHLERQRGGFGFIGGPGETQIEADRRVIGERMTKLKKELIQVQKTRHLHRQARKKIPIPVVALVGYTNTGKSTLFNQLTQANVFAKDQLFATLDPTMRSVKLPSGHRIILSDTVGFVSELPHELVAAFRATLEEVLEADLIIHVRDLSHLDNEAQKEDVLAVLREIGLTSLIEEGFIEVLNKIDRLDSESKDRLILSSKRSHYQIPLSAITGEGLEALYSLLDRLLFGADKLFTFTLAHSKGAALSKLYELGDVVERYDDDLKITGLVRLSSKSIGQFETLYGSSSIDSEKFYISLE
jgi:GTP-binding protein HflX